MPHTPISETAPFCLRCWLQPNKIFLGIGLWKTNSVLIRLCLLATVLLPTFTSQAQTNATKIAAGDAHTLLVDGYGTLWAMGENNVGQLGDGDTNNVNSPVKIAGNALHFGNTPSPTVTAVAARYEHSLFLMSDGSMWAMGQNNHGRIRKRKHHQQRRSRGNFD